MMKTQRIMELIKINNIIINLLNLINITLVSLVISHVLLVLTHHIIV